MKTCPKCAAGDPVEDDGSEVHIVAMTHVRQSTDQEGKTWDIWVCPRCNHREEVENKDGTGPGKRYVS